MDEEPPSQAPQSFDAPASSTNLENNPKPLRHALVIGGTGMLRDATLELATTYDVVSVIARNSFRLNGLWEEGQSLGLRINPVQLDYRDLHHLDEALNDLTEKIGEFTLVLAWIKSSAPETIYHLANRLNAQQLKPAYYDLITDINYENIDTDEEEREELFEELPNIDYRQIILGVKTIEDVQKWFSNDEISAGVTEAIQLGRTNYRLGTNEDSAQS